MTTGFMAKGTVKRRQHKESCHCEEERRGNLPYLRRFGMNKTNTCILVIALLVVCGRIGQSVAATPDVDIWKAAASGNIEAIKQHLAGGADVDAKDSPGGSTPLLVAAAFGQVEAVKFLIDRGANVKAQSNDGATALHGIGVKLS